MTIRTTRIVDTQDILDICAPYIRDTAISFKYELPSLTEMENKIESTLENYPFLVAIKEGKVVGFCYASAFRPHAAYSPSVETTLYVRTDRRGEGIGTGLYGELESILRRQNISMMNACIAVSGDGKDPYLDGSSIEFHRKLGFETLANIPDCAIKFGRPYGITWMCKRLSIPSEDRKFIPFPQIEYP